MLSLSILYQRKFVLKVFIQITLITGWFVEELISMNFSPTPWTLKNIEAILIKEEQKREMSMTAET